MKRITVIVLLILVGASSAQAGFNLVPFEPDSPGGPSNPHPNPALPKHGYVKDSFAGDAYSFLLPQTSGPLHIDSVLLNDSSRPFSIWAQLPSGKSEPSGVGLYSYLLLEKGEGDGARLRNLKVLKSLYCKLEEKDLTKRLLHPDQYSIVFVPVKSMVASEFSTPSNESLEDQYVSKLLDAYDFTAARNLLTTLHASADAKGPFMIAAQRPLRVASAFDCKHEKCILLDASRCDDDLTDILVSQYIHHSEQAEFWKKDYFDFFIGLHEALQASGRGVEAVDLAMRLAMQDSIWKFFGEPS